MRMKRIILCLLTLSFGLCVTANDDPHLLRLFECIDNANDSCAAEQLPLIKDWSPTSEWMDTYRAISLYYDLSIDACIDTTFASPSLVDSFALFIARDSRAVALYYYEKDDNETADEYVEIAIKFYRNAKKQDTKEYALTLMDAGNISQALGAISKAERYYLRALRVYDDVLKIKTPKYVRLLFNLTLLYDEISEYAEEEKYALQALYLHEKKFKKKLPLYAELLNNLGNLYLDLEDYNKAEKFYFKALAQKKKKYGEDSESYANTCYNLGRLYTTTKDYEKAKKYHAEALLLREQILGKESEDYATSADNLATVYNLMGDDDNGLLMYKEAFRAYKSVYGIAHPACTEVLDSIVTYYEKRDNYDSVFVYAGNLYVSAMQQYGDSNVISANAIFRFATVLLKKRYLDKATGMYRKAANAYRVVYGENSIHFAKCLMSLAYISIESGEGLQEVENYLSKAEKIISTQIGTDNKAYVTCLKLYGDYYMVINDRERASDYYAEAIVIVKYLGYDADAFRQSIVDQHNKKVTFEDNGIAQIIKKYCYNQRSFNTYYGFLNLFISSQLVLDELHHGVYSDTYIVSLLLSGEMYIRYGKPLDSKPYVERYFSIVKDKYINTVDFMTEAERMAYWDIYDAICTLFVPEFSYYATALNDTISTIAYDNELFAKGLLLSSSNNIRNSIIGSGDTTLIRQWNELKVKKQQIIALEGKSHQESTIAELRKQVEILEKEITRSSAAYREGQTMWNITWDSVRQSLTSNQVAIEYMSVPLNEDSTMYCALLLRDTCSYPDLIPLFEEKELLALVNTSTEGKTNGTYSFDGNGQALQQLIWSKILPYVKQGETIYFAPSGVLHQVAIEALPFDETHTMGDKFNLVRLSSTREIVLNKSKDTHTTASLYGGIHYDMTGEELLAESEQYFSSSLLASRGIENDTLDRGSVNYLPGTKKEVESIDKMLKDNHLSVQLFTMTSANEESFKAISGKHQNILHIATHGFYWSDSTAQKKDYFSQRAQRMDDNQPTLPALDPLNRCGLLFAGANTALSGHSADLPEGVQDGILTAKEISLLDLRDADLVVLSACETGKGEITGEGVFGLQRAFKQAGAQTIIMSLWPVNDAATQMLMTEFYRNWITNHQPKREAFRNAQNTVRTQFEEPVYWAGFIMLD